jgi:hypothetical protein
MLRPERPIAALIVSGPSCTNARVGFPGAGRTTIAEAVRLPPTLVFSNFLTSFCFARDLI